MSDATILEQLREVRMEITRVNQAAGRTVFNPAATDALEDVIRRAKAIEEALGTVRAMRK